MESIFTEPKNVSDINDCYFYHTINIPDHGLVHGEWDLRERELDYLGKVDFQGKRVLEIGTASGYLCFAMEKMGADVVAYDLSDEQKWDLVPFAELNNEEYIFQRKNHIKRLNNGFWFAHRAYKSQAKVVYGTVYEIPANIGEFDICTFGSVLLHLRDPFLALQCVTSHVRETAIVTDLVPESLSDSRLIRFLPDSQRLEPRDTWWQLQPELIAEFLRILGFEHTEVSYHQQRYQNKEIQLYTVVGRRTI